MNLASVYRNKQVYIFGGSGLIGHYLCLKLLKLGVKPKVLDIKKPLITNVKFHHLSLLDQAKVAKIINFKPDIIINLAGISGTTLADPRRAFQVNCIGAVNIINAVIKKSPHSVIVFSNSRQEYGKPQYLPVDEHHPESPLNYYGVAKLTITHLSKLYFKQLNLKPVILRTSNVFATPIAKKYVNYNIVSHWIKQAKKNQSLTIYGSGKQRRDYLYIDDLLDALLISAVTKQAQGQIINIGSGKGLSIKSMATSITDRFGGQVVHKPWPQNWRQAETGDYVSDITKAHKLLNWQPKYTFKQGIEQLP